MTTSALHEDDVLVRTRDLRKYFHRPRRLSDLLRGHRPEPVRAVDGVNLVARRGEVLGVAGESGSGKTVTAEMIAGLQQPTEGSILFSGTEVVGARGADLAQFRRDVSMVFQDPFDSLNSRLRIQDTISEPLRIHKVGSRADRVDAVHQMLERVRLLPARFYAEKFPHELSGGERQRVAVARALILGPKLLIADEPTTMLDVSIRAGLLNLLRDMQQEQELTMIFISHDFSTLAYLSDRIMIMYQGVVVESGPADSVLGRQLHPYTEALAAAIPRPDPDADRPRGATAERDGRSETPQTGCRFAPRCPHRIDRCVEEEPALLPSTDQHSVACHLLEERAAQAALQSHPLMHEHRTSSTSAQRRKV